MRNQRIAITAAILIGVIGAGIYSYLSPGIALESIRTAAQSNDKDRLRDLIDFDSVKTGLKEDIKSLLVASAAKDLKDNPFAALGLAMINMMVDPMVDSIVSPAGITGLIDRGKLEAPNKSDSKIPAIGSIESKTSQDGLDIQRGYDDWSNYRVRIKSSSKNTDDPLTLTLRRQGMFSWKLTRVSLPKSALGDVANTGNRAPSDPAFTPAQLKAMVGKHPQEVIKSEPLSKLLKQMVGKDWEAFETALSVSTEVVDADGFIFGSGCAPHLCSVFESSFSIEKSTGRIVAMLLNDGKWQGWGMTKAKDELRGPMRKWAVENGVIEVDCDELAKLGLERPDCSQTAKQTTSPNPEPSK